MRCPECNQRNSVAAKKCAACDVPLRRKPIPLSFKVFVGTMVGIVFVFWLAALSSAINNPEKTLTSTASTLTGKSNSAEQMMGNIKHFDKAMNQFLQKYSPKSCPTAQTKSNWPKNSGFFSVGFTVSMFTLTNAFSCCMRDNEASAR